MSLYVPPAFAEPDPATLLALVEARGFGTLVTGGATARALPDVTHLPVTVERRAGTLGVLHGHLARANPHAAALLAAGGPVEALAIFTGPDAYVSPGWYPSKREHGRAVPTWNYVAVHVTGTLRVVDDPAAVHAGLVALTGQHEHGRAEPWAVDDAPPGFVEQQMRQIVGLTLEVTRLEGKWKLSQNRSAADIDGVVHGLAAEPDAHARTVAALVEARRPPSKR